MESVIKLGYMRCLCSMNEIIRNFALSPLYMIYMKLIMALGIKLGRARCLCWKR